METINNNEEVKLWIKNRLIHLPNLPMINKYQSSNIPLTEELDNSLNILTNQALMPSIFHDPDTSVDMIKKLRIKHTVDTWLCDILKQAEEVISYNENQLRISEIDEFNKHFKDDMKLSYADESLCGLMCKKCKYKSSKCICSEIMSVSKSIFDERIDEFINRLMISYNN